MSAAPPSAPLARPRTRPLANAPVFTVGCPRSGTTLLYHMLLSAGGFAHYRAETHIFNSLAPRFGGMRTGRDIRGALEVWLRSDCHALSGVPTERLRARIEASCRTPGDFLRIVMDEMAQRQHVARWAETTPAHLLYMGRIARQIPDARFVHVIRDGRDAACSLAQQRWIAPLAVDRQRPVLGAAAFWRWMVERGRREGRGLCDRYLEVRYEDLIDEPQATLDAIGDFIGQRLDYAEIQRTAIGSVRRPNTSFPGVTSAFRGRWRSTIPAEDAVAIDGMLAPTLRTLGYLSDASREPHGIAARRMAYTARFEARHLLKEIAPLARRSTSLALFVPGALGVTPDKLPSDASTSSPLAESSADGSPQRPSRAGPP